MRQGFWWICAGALMLTALGCPRTEDCDNGSDDDGDGKADCLDEGCAEASSCKTCGNNALDTGEQCDGQNHEGKTCQDRGFDTGALACKSDCTFDEGGCSDE